MHADRILCLDNGQIIEQGTHEDLLLLGGRYRDLYELQMHPNPEILAKKAGIK